MLTNNLIYPLHLNILLSLIFQIIIINALILIHNIAKITLHIQSLPLNLNPKQTAYPTTLKTKYLPPSKRLIFPFALNPQ